MHSPPIKKAYQPRIDYQNKPPHIFPGYCYGCSNFGHNTRNCRHKRNPKSEEACFIALKAQDKGDLWYVDSGCSKHMTGDRDKFLNLEKQKGRSLLVTMPLVVYMGKEL